MISPFRFIYHAVYSEPFFIYLATIPVNPEHFLSHLLDFAVLISGSIFYYLHHFHKKGKQKPKLHYT